MRGDLAPVSPHPTAAAPPTIWTRGREPAHALAALAFAMTLSLVVIDFALNDSVGRLFDIGFAALCVGLGVLVRPGDFIVVGALPPAALGAVFALLGLTSPGMVAHPDDGMMQSMVSGISHHSLALLLGYAGCLGVLSYRYRLLTRASAH